MEQDPGPDSPPPTHADDPAPSPGTGLFYKDGREIPSTHPDHGPMHLLPRQEDGSFAAYYYCSKAELYDMQVPAPPPRRQRRDGFSAERQEQFLEAVRGGASGREAARLVGISPTTAYNLYNSPDGAAFKAAWDEAAQVTDIVLEDTAFDRAVNGQEEIVYHQGQRVGRRWKYDNNLLMRLLRARNPLKYAPLSEIEGWLRHRGIAPPADVDGALERLRAAEAEWGSWLPGEEAPAAIADQAVRPELVEGPSCRSGEEDKDGPSTGSGRTDQRGTDTLSLPSASIREDLPDPSTSSTSPGNEQPESPPAALLPGEGRGPGLPPPEAGPRPSPGNAAQPTQPPHPSTSSTSSGSGQPENAADASMSSTSSGNGREALPPAAEATAPTPEDAPLINYRPPPRPRITQL